MTSHPVYAYPSIPQALGLCGLLVLAQLGLGIPIGFIDVAFGLSLATKPAVLAMLSVLAFGCVWAWGYRKLKVPLSAVIPLSPVGLGLLVPMAMTAVGGSILLSEADNLLQLFLPTPQWIIEAFGAIMAPGDHFWSSALLLTIVAPVTEELLFRGIILRGFLMRYSVRKSIVVSAILFALMHMNPWQLMVGLTWGLMLGWWYVRTRSLVPCLFGHAVMNGTGLLASAIPGLEIPGYTSAAFGAAEFQPLWFDLLGVVLVGCGLIAIARGFAATPHQVPRIPLARPVTKPAGDAVASQFGEDTR